jgi:hypothetical protein
MARFYGILSVIGWVWAIVVVIVLPILYWRKKQDSQQQGFEVSNSDEKHL